MAHHKSALKRIRQTKKTRVYNRLNKKVMKEAVKAVRLATSFEEGQDKLKTAVKVLDRNTARGIVHKNTAANRKSKLAKFVNKLQTKQS